MTEKLSPEQEFHRTLYSDKTYKVDVGKFDLVRPAVKSIMRLCPDPSFAWVETHSDTTGTLYALTETHIYASPYGANKSPDTTVLPLDLTRLVVGGDPDKRERATLNVDMHVRHHADVITIRAHDNHIEPGNVGPLQGLLPVLRDAVRPEQESGEER